MSGGIALLGPTERTGDAYKWVTMLSRAADKPLSLSHHDHEAAIKKAKPCFAVVRGDHRSTYQIAMQHGLPYILLEGDVSGMTHGSSDREREMIENASAVVFNTSATREWCANHYDLPDVVETVYLRPLKEQLRFEPLAKLETKTLCYAGGLQHYGQLGTPSAYRVYHDIFREFMSKGWQVHLYVPLNTSRRTRVEYHSIGCVMHNFVPERNLPMVLSQYTCGLQSFNGKRVPRDSMDYINIAIPNKTWLYLAAGIPTLGLQPTGAGGKFYDGKWGIVTDRIEESYSFPKIDPALREEEVMDRDIAAFRRLVCAVSPG